MSALHRHRPTPLLAPRVLVPRWLLPRQLLARQLLARRVLARRVLVPRQLLVPRRRLAWRVLARPSPPAPDHRVMVRPRQPGYPGREERSGATPAAPPPALATLGTVVLLRSPLALPRSRPILT
ncbi:hypothetical protein V6U90_05865 [Micromonospora sp. CPCC 206060]|uniref:hypothetical protein n=1 Tax=Micromonospora sp. CPCC 206060 TaxID=3122406 RepID=UPI002FF2BCD6